MFAYSDATFIWYESLILIATLLRLLGLLCAEHLMIPQLRLASSLPSSLSPGNAAAWKRVSSLGLILSSLFFPSELLHLPHPIGACLALRLGKCLWPALAEFTQCLCVFVHSADSKQSARLVNKAESSGGCFMQDNSPL
jgi:hypothetical protein